MRATNPLAILLAVAVAVAPTAAAGRSLSGVNPLDICETYDHDTCLQHADTCTSCLAWGRYNTCFETAIAKKLPTKLFVCDFPAPSPPPTPSDLNADCASLGDEAACSAAHCVWCLSAAVRSACYTEDEARRLPPAVFRCKLPSLSEQ